MRQSKNYRSCTKSAGDLLRSMRMEKLTKFDAAEYLDADGLQTLYLDEVLKENDPLRLSKRQIQ